MPSADVFTLLFSPECLPFSIALAVMAGIGLLELGALLLGAGLGHVLDALLPDLDVHLELPEASLLERALGWLGVGRVPVLMVLVAALTWFGLTGLALQALASAALGTPVSSALASAVALVVTFPMTRLSAGLIGRVLPNHETSAVSRAGFVGRIATMLQGEARRGAPAQAKLCDQFGQTHYLLVEPEDDGAVLGAGEDVLLVRQSGARFTAIKNPHPLLSAERTD